MSSSDERDYAEESYNRDLCPECDYSPCVGEGRRGSCVDGAARVRIVYTLGGRSFEEERWADDSEWCQAVIRDNGGAVVSVAPAGGVSLTK